MKRIGTTTRANFLTYGMVLAVYFLMQALSGAGLLTSSLTGQLVPICAYVIMAISLNLTVGILGELSLGHAGFMSIGAFSGVVTAVSLQGAVPHPVARMVCALVVGGVLAAGCGALVGIPVLRLRGDYLAIVTLAFGEIIKNIINFLYIGVDGRGLHFGVTSAAELRMDPDGIVILNGPMGAIGNQKLSTFTMGVALILLCLVVILNLMNSRSGRAIMALRDNRIAAESVGINVTSHKLMAFVTSAGMAGMAGVLFAMNYSSVAARKFDFNTSILILVFVVLGGMGNIRGSIIAATVLTVLPELLRKFDDWRMLVYAVVLILVMLVTNNPQLKTLLNMARDALRRPGRAAERTGKGGRTDGTE